MSFKNPKQICLLGATGSIGTSALNVIKQHPDSFHIHSVAAGSNWQALIPIIQQFKVEKACLWQEDAAKALKKHVNIPVFTGMDGLLELVQDQSADYVLNGMVGAVGCLPTLEAIKASKHIGLANKETMVMAGSIINQALKDNASSSLIPIDSEHSAIFQCLGDRPSSEVEHLLLTASGGPFLSLPADQFAHVTKERALAHPTWDMGPKITIDSSTLMNKGLEVIEAHFLFNITFDKIRVVIHPTSTVHSFVQFVDGSLMAQLGSPDMQLPILYALVCPQRWPLNIERLDLATLGKLEFFPPDFEKFPCLRLAFDAGKMGGSAPAVLNAANEEVVSLFLNEKINYLDIPRVIEDILNLSTITASPTLEQVLSADKEARSCVRELLKVKE